MGAAASFVPIGLVRCSTPGMASGGPFAVPGAVSSTLVPGRYPVLLGGCGDGKDQGGKRQGGWTDIFQHQAILLRSAPTKYTKHLIIMRFRNRK